MEVKKYNPFVVKEASPLVPQLKAKPLPKAKTKPKPKTKLEAKGLSLENKNKQGIIFAKGFLKTRKK